jgi:hypothetical protein
MRLIDCAVIPVVAILLLISHRIHQLIEAIESINLP